MTAAKFSHRQGAAQPQLRWRGRRAGHRRGGSCFAAAGRPGRCRLYGRERQRPRRTDDLWTGSGPYPADEPACHRCRKTHSGGDSGAVRVSMCKYIVKVIFLPVEKVQQNELHPIC